ncbi:MAG TPA: LacI family DNA-binding transcriptional regulator [Candidatus Mediterraneibacter faecipullorum]|uniref:Ribokinase n=1 Tax=Candidatus Mediterraneibacter faecipullorum TaxID=2838670 RepID=A0A9D2NLE9_9FIRM|nr:LacI family DNA-binding transcriptional regulator [Candidatus Mediterraneibacter faecipullorum]
MNIKEIAQLAGVSTSTVSKIVNQKDSSISKETREKVLRIVKEYNYTPYSSAAVSTHQKTWTLGVLLRSSISFDKTLDGLIQTAQAKGYTAIVCNSCSDSEQELKNITSLCKNKVDGIIWEPVCDQSLENAFHIEKKNIPYLTLGPSGKKDRISLPYEEFAYRLTRELIKNGHKNIACLLTKGRRTSDFLSGYKKCLFENHLTLNEDFIFYEFTESLIYKINTHQISAIVSSHYQKALEFYQLMNSLHYRIPEDFSLISLKNDTSETLVFPDISTYTVSNTDFGAFLCEKLINQIEKNDTDEISFSQKFQLDSTSTIGSPYTFNSAKITVVGSINMDVYLNVPQLPHTGKTVSTSVFSVYPGGKGINQAIGAARLGHHVSLIGNVGSDMDSDQIYQTLNENGVDTSGVKRCTQADTGKAYIFVDSVGDSMISILTGANALFTPQDIRKRKHLFENTGYCLIQSEIPPDTLMEACQIAHEHNAKTIVKPSACSSMTWEMLSMIDIIIPNEDELFELCSKYYPSMEAQAASMLECGIQVVIVTLNERGCYVKTKDWDEYFPAVHFPAIDKTGASDAFISAFASYLLYGYELKSAVKIATYAAGFCISREGVLPALIDRSSLESYINQNEPGLLHLPA